jgi:hypothetical protein
MKKGILLLLISFGIVSCVTIKPGEVGLKQRLGKLSDEVYPQVPFFLIHFLQKLFVLRFKQGTWS